MTNIDCGARTTWPGRAVGPRAPVPTGAQNFWVREFGLLPSAGLVVDPSVLSPFSLAGLGLTRLDRWRTPARPLPVVSRLAVDITNPHALSITYREHSDDAETPLAQEFFADEHPAGWVSALAEQDHILLTVSYCAALVASDTPAAVVRSLDGAWAGIIACGANCVDRSGTSPSAICARHRLPDRTDSKQQ